VDPLRLVAGAAGRAGVGFHRRGEWRIDFDCRQDVFDEAAGRGALDRFVALLDAAVARPKPRWTACCPGCVSPSASSAPGGEGSMSEIVSGWAARTPDQLAVVSEHGG